MTYSTDLEAVHGREACTVLMLPPKLKDGLDIGPETDAVLLMCLEVSLLAGSATVPCALTAAACLERLPRRAWERVTFAYREGSEG